MRYDSVLNIRRSGMDLREDIRMGEINESNAIHTLVMIKTLTKNNPHLHAYDKRIRAHAIDREIKLIRKMKSMKRKRYEY